MSEPFPDELFGGRVTLQRVTPGMEDTLQEVFEAAGDHFTTITGRPSPDPDAAQRELASAATAPGREVFLIRLRDAETPVGAVGWWEQHPIPEITLLGMLLVGIPHREQGIAREALELLGATLAGRGARELRTGVGAGDVARQKALTALGFEPLDERKHIALDRGRVMIALFRKVLAV